MNGDNHVRQLIEFLSGLSERKVPKKTVERAKLAIMDFFGNSLGAIGTGHGLISALLDFASESEGVAESTLLGKGKRINCLEAAMTYGVLGNFLDFSDGHFRGGHVNDRVVPAALAVAERVGATGGEFIMAVLAGYESYVRMGYALFGNTDPASVKAPLFVDLGPMASSIAVGKLLGLTVEQMAGAMGLAASMQISAAQYTVSGGHEKDLCPGHEARRAVFSALMAQKGVFGSKDILEGARGLSQLVGGALDLSKLTDGLGEDFKIHECYFKPYPACRYLHSSIDAALHITREHEVKPESIEGITVTTNSSSARRASYEILSHVSAIFSHQYQVAVVLAEGRPDLPVHWREKMQRGTVGELMKRTKVLSSEEFDDLHRRRTLDYGTWPSHVEVLTRTGDEYDSTVLRPKGDPTNPMTNEELENKLRTNALRVLSEDQVDELQEKIRKLEDIDDISTFVQELAREVVARKRQ
jgi:2-methylcitrate dehydratase PrpD